MKQPRADSRIPHGLEMEIEIAVLPPSTLPSTLISVLVKKATNVSHECLTDSNHVACN